MVSRLHFSLSVKVVSSINTGHEYSFLSRLSPQVRRLSSPRHGPDPPCLASTYLQRIAY